MKLTLGTLWDIVSHSPNSLTFWESKITVSIGGGSWASVFGILKFQICRPGEHQSKLLEGVYGSKTSGVLGVSCLG